MIFELDSLNCISLGFGDLLSYSIWLRINCHKSMVTLSPSSQEDSVFSNNLAKKGINKINNFVICSLVACRLIIGSCSAEKNSRNILYWTYFVINMAISKYSSHIILLMKWLSFDK